MASLSSEVQARYPAQLLIGLTNPQNNSASAINSTVMDAAIADAVNEFANVGLSLDSADVAIRHVSAACYGVMYFLYQYRQTLDSEFARAEELWQRALHGLVQATARDRILPSSNNELSLSSDLGEGQSERYLAFDERHFDGLAPWAPRSSSTRDDWS
jgi:hypothetical protein